MVAHDRWFLEAVGTAVLELEAGRARFFNGTWASWRREQAARELALGRAIEKQQAEIARMERFVERFRYKASKARQAQSRVKKLDKMERIERDPRDGRALGFEFKRPERSGRVIFELEDGRLEVGEEPRKVLLAGAELWLERSEHVSLVGPNGVGKTTLIEALAGRRELDGGRLRSGHNVRVGYLSQHGEELEHGGARTVLEAAVKGTGLTPNQARSLLGQFLFSGEEAEKPLEGLSGGERKRLALAILVQSGANVLILDEPTNHLDLESREALEDALSAFPGALLLVTHDRALLDAVGSRTIAVEDYALRSYVGGWPEYRRVREERKARGDAAGAAPPPRRPPPKPAAARGEAAVEEPPARAGAPRAGRRGRRGDAGGGRGRAGRPGALGHEVRVREGRAPGTPRPSVPSRTPTPRSSASRRRRRPERRASLSGPDKRAARLGPAPRPRRAPMDHDDQPTQGGRRRLAVVAALLALAAAIPAAGALASGSGGDASGGGTPPATQGVQDQQDRQGGQDRRHDGDGRDCPKHRGGSSGGSSGTSTDTALPV